MKDCAICCEKYNISNRKRVECPFCAFTTCRSCVQNFLLNTSSDPHCMECKRLWAREVIDESCTATFRNGPLKLHRQQILFERERCLMPATVDAVARVKAIRNLGEIIKEAQEEVIRAQLNVSRLQRDIMRLQNGGAHGEEAQEKRKFVRKCPSENCKGFLTTQWNCQLCEKHICKDCNEEVRDGHVCDPNNVQTVELLNKDTKPCPSCGTMIFKISGCNQMWCPDCHTAFDWKTMRIETGRVHNPHYYDFQRALHNGAPPREPGDIPCGGLPSIRELYTKLGVIGTNRRHTDEQSNVRILALHRLAEHVRGIELAVYERPPEQVNQDLRVRYMMDELAEDTFKKMLQSIEKQREKKRDCRQIFQMFVDVASDHFRQFVAGDLKRQDFEETMEKLREYTNTSFEKVHKRFGLKCPNIPQGWSTRY